MLAFIFSVAAQDGKQRGSVKAENIENIKIHNEEIGENFVLFRENLFKPNKQTTGQISQRWERNSSESDLRITEEETTNLEEPVGASCKQKWYRSGKKEKIEIDIIICSSEIEIDKTIEIFTKKMYSINFKQSATPLVGDVSWVAFYPDNESDSYSVMYLMANVFVRIYLNIKDENFDKSNFTINNIASNIESKILLEL
jgi:hypothetical protein